MSKHHHRYEGDESPPHHSHHTHNHGVENARHEAYYGHQTHHYSHHRGHEHSSHHEHGRSHSYGSSHHYLGESSHHSHSRSHHRHGSHLPNVELSDERRQSASERQRDALDPFNIFGGSRESDAMPHRNRVSAYAPTEERGLGGSRVENYYARSSYNGSGLGATIAREAQDAVGTSQYRPRRGSNFTSGDVPAALGCASTVTNILYDALRQKGLVGDGDYRRIHNVGIAGMESQLIHSGMAHYVNPSEARPGDILIGKNPGRHGHTGIVGPDGKVVNNHAGIVGSDSWQARFGHYRDIRVLRVDA